MEMSSSSSSTSSSSSKWFFGPPPPPFFSNDLVVSILLSGEAPKPSCAVVVYPVPHAKARWRSTCLFQAKPDGVEVVEDIFRGVQEEATRRHRSHD